VSGLESYYVIAFVVAVLSWVGLTSALVLGRLAHDTRHRPVRLARRRLAQAGRRAVSSERARTLERMLGRLSRTTIDRVAADSGGPLWLSEAFAHHSVRRWGIQRLLRDACAHRGERTLWRRIAALRMIVQVRHAAALGLLENALQEDDPRLRDAAVSLLARLPDRLAAELLLAALRSGAVNRSRIATSVDGFTLPIPGLVLALLQESDANLRFWGATLLARYPGPATTAALVARAADADPNVRKAAVESLGKVGGEGAVAAARTLIDDPVWYVKAHAARALGELRDCDSAGAITALLSHDQWWVRLAAKEALVAIGGAATAAVADALHSDDRFARNGAAEVLQNMGVLGELLHEALAATLDDERRDLLRRILAEGGGGMMEGVLDGLDFADRRRAASVLSELGLEQAGAA
jgi:HEAT repeat protein